jgi:hypothetical protein
MFKKIHSNRDPKDTLFTEIRKEFAVYIDSMSRKIVYFLKKNPDLTYTMMLLFLGTSIILSFTVFRNKDPRPEVSANVIVSPITNGFSRILETGAALKESIKLKEQIELLIAKDTLTKADSLFLGKAIDRLHQLSIQHEKSN